MVRMRDEEYLHKKRERDTGRTRRVHRGYLTPHTTSQSSSRVQQNLGRIVNEAMLQVHRTYLATSDGCAEGVIADTDLFVYDVICEVVPPTCHSADKYGDGVRLRQGR